MNFHDEATSANADVLQLRIQQYRSEATDTIDGLSPFTNLAQAQLHGNSTMAHLKSASIAFLAAALFCTTATGQGRPDPAKLIPAQQTAIAKLAFMDGIWRGTAWTLLPSGEKHTLTQTERVGPFLDGAVKVIEGRGYESDGKLAFNAFGTISFNPGTGTYSIRSYAMGSVGDFALTPTPNGFVWEIPAGPMTLRYTATIQDGAWQEVGDRIIPGKDPIRFFEMNLKRIGDTTWPASDWVPAK